MEDTITANRRRFLQSAGVGGSALLAGCSERLNVASEDDDSDGERQAGVVADIDESDIRAIQSEIQEEVEEGELEQAEAQQELRDRQRELLEREVGTLAETLESELSVTAGEQIPELGAVRASGDASALFDALTLDDVKALIPADELQQDSDES